MWNTCIRSVKQCKALRIQVRLKLSRFFHKRERIRYMRMGLVPRKTLVVVENMTLYWIKTVRR